MWKVITVILGILLVASIAYNHLQHEVYNQYLLDLQEEYMETYNLYQTLQQKYYKFQQIRTSQHVVFTAFNPVPEQTDDTPMITASGHPVDSRTLAISWDLRSRYAFGDTVYVILPLVVRDVMHPRWRNRADIMLWKYDDAIQFGVRQGWLLQFHQEGV